MIFSFFLLKNKNMDEEVELRGEGSVYRTLLIGTIRMSGSEVKEQSECVGV